MDVIRLMAFPGVYAHLSYCFRFLSSRPAISAIPSKKAKPIIVDVTRTSFSQAFQQDAKVSLWPEFQQSYCSNKYASMHSNLCAIHEYKKRK